jgi:transcriptional regulator with XRE-family HTH domain
MQDDLDKAAGARLRELRIAAGASQEDVSFAAKLDQSTLSKVERVGPGVISWARFCRVAAVLGYDVEVTYRPAKNTTGDEVSRPATPASARRL